MPERRGIAFGGGVKDMDEKRELASRMAELFALPTGLVMGQSHIELLGDSGFFMEGHGGVLSYSTEEICLGGGKCTVRVTGEGLTLRAMTSREVHISGRVDAVAFLR